MFSPSELLVHRRCTPLAGILLALGGCSEASDPTPGPELPLLDPAADWVGTYQGQGQGTVDGRPVVIDDAVVTMAFDAPDVKLPNCSNCITVTLNDVFRMSNIRVDNLTSLDLTYLEGKVRHTLELRRFTLGVDHPNVLRAHATYGNEDAPTPIFDVQYVLER